MGGRKPFKTGGFIGFTTFYIYIYINFIAALINVRVLFEGSMLRNMSKKTGAFGRGSAPVTSSLTTPPKLLCQSEPVIVGSGKFH